MLVRCYRLYLHTATEVIMTGRGDRWFYPLFSTRFTNAVWNNNNRNASGSEQLVFRLLLLTFPNTRPLPNYLFKQTHSRQRNSHRRIFYEIGNFTESADTYIDVYYTIKEITSDYKQLLNTSTMGTLNAIAIVNIVLLREKIGICVTST